MACATTGHPEELPPGLLLLSSIAAALVLTVFGGAVLEYAELMSLTAPGRTSVLAMQLFGASLLSLGAASVLLGLVMAAKRCVEVRTRRFAACMQASGFGATQARARGEQR